MIKSAQERDGKTEHPILSQRNARERLMPLVEQDKPLHLLWKMSGESETDRTAERMRHHVYRSESMCDDIVVDPIRQLFGRHDLLDSFTSPEPWQI